MASSTTIKNTNGDEFALSKNRLTDMQYSKNDASARRYITRTAVRKLLNNKNFRTNGADATVTYVYSRIRPQTYGHFSYMETGHFSYMERGRLSIGCQEFSRYYTRIIRRWATAVTKRTRTVKAKAMRAAARSKKH